MRYPFPVLASLPLLAALTACQTSPEPARPGPEAAQPVASAKPAPPPPAPGPSSPAAPLGSTRWTALFNGHDLTGWTRTDYAGGCEPEVVDGRLLIGMSASLGGVNWTNAAGFPTTNYEIELEAMKLEGSDFFCGLTFPVGDSHCSFIVGGWGGIVVGLSSIDGMDASSNETTTSLFLERNRWFALRVRVTPDKIVCWIDDKPVVDLDTTDKRIAMRHGEIELSKPLGLATYQTVAAFRNLRFRRLP